MATFGSALVGTAVFDARKLWVRFSWLDVPAVVWCACPLASSLVNDLGLYDGVSTIATRLIWWGIPYWIGRAYFCDYAAIADLGMAFLLGGLLYVPLCLFEIRMSPQLYPMVYGFRPDDWNFARFSGWRPNVFLENGLALGLWMSIASLLALSVLSERGSKRLCGVPLAVPVITLLVTTVLCKALGALLLLGLTFGVFTIARQTRSFVPAFLLLMFPLVYMGARMNRIGNTSRVVQTVSSWVGADRAHSLATRFENENRLVSKALRRPILGWGGWGRSRVIDPETGKDITRSDGRWVIVLGENGVVGLTALFAVLWLPAVTFFCRSESSYWHVPGWPTVAAVALLLAMFLLERLLNAQKNPLVYMCAGAIVSICTGPMNPHLRGWRKS